jgi:hypothetical protein
MYYQGIPAPLEWLSRASSPTIVSMKSRLSLRVLVLLSLLPSSAGAWGGDVHRLINRSAVECLPTSFQAFGQWAGTLEQLSTEADSRKEYVSGEGVRHYIDIDDYPAFFSGTLPHDYQTMVTLYGSQRVVGNGTAPWAVDETYRNLVAAFQAKNWTQAVALAADIGHYVGDVHNPLHDTTNFDGEDTGQSGIHSRFESEMTHRYMALLTPSPQPTFLVNDALGAVFSWIDDTYPGVQVILNADKAAKAESGGSTRSTTYYGVLWSETGQYTCYWIGKASVAVASLWYSAWHEAGSPPLPGTSPVQAVTVGRLKTMFLVPTADR